MIVAICIALAALVAGGYGLYNVAFAQGYVNGVEDTKYPEGWTFTEEE